MKEEWMSFLKPKQDELQPLWVTYLILLALLMAVSFLAGLVSGSII